MKNQIKYLMNCVKLSLIFVLITFQSCKKDWLEAKVDKSLAVPQTVKDFQAMLDYSIGLGAVNYSSSCQVLNEVASDGHFYTESFFNSITSSNFHNQNAYIWAAKQPYWSISGYLSQYQTPYTTILDMNIILDESKKSNDSNKSGLEQVRAQALFNRSRMFFDLAQTYAPVYNSATANLDLGIALRLSTDITDHSVRSTVKQTYDQIISDLNAAVLVLPDVPQFVTRASKPAALGLLAKVYLSMGDYSNAFRYANEYLKINNVLLNYSTISRSASFIGLNNEVTFLRLISNPSFLTTNYLIDQQLYDSYDDDDLRKKIFFNVTAAGITFKGSYGNSIDELFAGIATDEIYLIRAEGYARNGNITSAMRDLNDLLRTRWEKNPDGSTKYINQTAIDEADALKKIINERKKQLILRAVRWTDLRRLNLEDRFKVTLTRTIGGQTYILEPNSFRYTFPFPKEVIEITGMPQNPGWE